MDCGRTRLTPELGIIEAYFGRAWTWQERAAVVRRLAPLGYRFFHYAPKIEAKLRRDWRCLHDVRETAAIASFAQACRAAGVRFGVGFTPYDAHLAFDQATRAAIKAKLAQFGSWGIDDLAILFDDMRGDLADLAERQAEIANFVRRHSKASRFFFCPSYYSDDPVLDRVFGARPDRYLETLGQALDPAFAIYWTGEEVCSPEIGVAHLKDVATRLGRQVALWDNYPVNDGPRMSHHLHLRSFTGRSPNIGAYVSHHAINPASQPVLGCIAAMTLPMLYAQGGEYRYSRAFQDAARAVCGPELATMLHADLLAFQQAGRDRMTAETRAGFKARYAAIDHPAAQEVIDWLEGGYAITGEALQTQ